MLSNAAAMRFWSTPPHASLDETREWLERLIASPEDESDDFVVEFEGRTIGKAGCWRIPEVGYILHPDFWGRGFAREAMEAVIAHAFARFPVEALTADVHPRNRASLGLLKRLGFNQTGRAEHTWCVAGEWSDSVYLALPRPVIRSIDASETP